MDDPVDPPRIANLLGAVALGVTDRIRAAREAAAVRGGDAAGALSAVGHAPGLTIGQLAATLGLSHPGMVRLVDSLAAEGLVERRPDLRDKRAVSLRLTPEGEARRARFLQQRASALAPVLAPLTAAEQARLARLLDKMLTGLATDALKSLAVCRLCDESVCIDCPVDRTLMTRATAKPDTG